MTVVSGSETRSVTAIHTDAGDVRGADMISHAVAAGGVTAVVGPGLPAVEHAARATVIATATLLPRGPTTGSHRIL